MYIAFTPGEPAGIGIDLAVMHAQIAFDAAKPALLTFSDPDLLLSRAKMLGLSITIKEGEKANKKGDISIIPIKLNTKAKAGVLDENNADFILRTLDAAIDACADNTCQAMLTGPVNKGIINQAGIDFIGHTEYLAKKTHCHVVMMLANDILKVALLTTHIPLRKVAQHITKESLERSIKILHHALTEKFQISAPHIGVCGLNPHAGEYGYLGDEETKIINPVIKNLKSEGIKLTGALPADTIFTPKKLNMFDVILAMYHDQGLAPLKALDFKKSVNITLGLPFVRISVSHGTACALAGTGHIDLDSFNSALHYLQKLI